MDDSDHTPPPNIVIKGLQRPNRPRAWGPKPDEADGACGDAGGDAPAEPTQWQLERAARRAKREQEEAEELADAMNTPYYWWWVFLQESDDYRRAAQGRQAEPEVVAMVKDFGRLLNGSFDHWWFLTGRDLFAQKRAIPVVRELDDRTIIVKRDSKPCVYLEIPLAIRRATALRQINRVLAQHFKSEDGGRHNVFAYSQAKRDINRSSKIRVTTLKQFHDVWMDRKQYPHSAWWETGERLGLSPSFINDAHTHPMNRRDNNRKMALTVQRIYRKTQRLIHFAARGEFPRVA